MDLPARGNIQSIRINDPLGSIGRLRPAASTPSSPAPSHFRSDEHHQEALKETRQPTPFHPTTNTIRILNPTLPSLLGVSG